MGFPLRKDVGLRLGIEKGIYPDEALARSQPQAGPGITITYLANGDLLFSALGSAGQIIVNNNGEIVLGPRMMSGEILCDQWDNAGFYSNLGSRHVAMNEDGHYLHDGDPNTDIGSAAEKRWFGTAQYNDIVHNWHLDNKDTWLLTLTDIRTGLVSPYSVKSVPKVVAIDNNTIRIWVTVPWDITDPGDWQANNNSLVGVTPPGGYQLLRPRYRFTLQEYV